jgi:hypothetical protein
LKEKTAICATIEAMTEGEAQIMVDRIFALSHAIEHLPYTKKELDQFFVSKL